jgi:DNA-binding PadR family transcriptional regulator
MNPSEWVSFSTGKKVFFLDKLESGKPWLFFYERGVDTWGVHRSFLENGLSKGELCFFAWEETSQDLHPEQIFEDAVKNERLFLYRMRARAIGGLQDLDRKMEKAFSRASAENVPLRIVIDFGSLPEFRNTSIILDAANKIAEKRKQLPTCTSMISVDVGPLDEETSKSLMKLHENLILSRKTETSFLPLGFSMREIEGEVAQVVSRETLEEIVKANLKTVILSMLRSRPMCGYHLIKSIHQRYHTLVSQGTIYPLLYTLAEQEILKVETQNRLKVYALTEKGRAMAEEKIRDFLQTHRYLAESMGIG